MGRYLSIWRSSALLALAASLGAAGIQVPNGAEIQVRLKSKVSTQTSKPKDPVEVVVIAPVMVGGQFAIPAVSPRTRG